MSTSTPTSPQLGSFLDYQLDEICRRLQLSQTQFSEAETKYGAVADWLGHDTSPLSHLDPTIFPQGSARVGTTVQPIGGDEHDVDLVLLLRTPETDAMRLYRAVESRLAEHDTYAALLERKNRCLRLVYAGEFHLDILPARPDDEGPDTWIVVPDRELQNWSPSAPEGHARWFEQQAYAVYEPYEERDVEPLPEPEDADEKSPLHRAVQLLKRRRDVYFDGDGHDVAPSVILRTLAGHSYGRERTVLEALDGVVQGIDHEIDGSSVVPDVPNPANPHENFADGWDQAEYRRFAGFIADVVTEVEELRQARDPDVRIELLERMFGETVSQVATEAAGKRYKEARESGNLSAGPAGVAIGAAGNDSRDQQVPNHEFHGGRTDDA